MKILRGISFDDPILISKSENDRNKMVMRYERFDVEQSKTIPKPFYASGDSCISFLDILFGGNDYNYFIKTESSHKTDKGTYKIYFIEDLDGDSHTIFFLIQA